MSLIDSAMTACAIMDKKTVDDGVGGVTTKWVEGAKIDCAIILDNSMQARIAQQQGVKNVYTITTKQKVVFDFHDVIKRLEDGKIFRITSDGEDKKSPKASTLDIRQVTAEEWTL